MNLLPVILLLLPLAAGVLCIGASPRYAHRISSWVCALCFALSVLITVVYYVTNQSAVAFLSITPWIDFFHAQIRLGVDGMSLPLLLLTTFLFTLASFCGLAKPSSHHALDHDHAAQDDPANHGAPVEPLGLLRDDPPSLYSALFLFLLAATLGVFLALDLLLLYVFFELSVIPMFFLIGVWGGANRRAAATKFFVVTLAGSLCLLLVMLSLFFITPHGTADSAPTWIIAGAQAGETSLLDPQIRGLLGPGGEYWQWGQIAFFLTLVAFMVKLAVVPVHSWLPDAHTEAPTPISMLLAGVMLKLGGYGLFRVTYPLFPGAAQKFWLVVALIATVSIVYGALCALAQTDWKRLVAYSSVSHMGYVLLGLAVLTPTALSGSYFQLIGHGVSSAMMFFVVGVIYDRAHHRDLNRLGGIWNRFPGFGGWSLLAFLAGMGLPGLCGFVGELMVLLGTFQGVGNPSLWGALGVASPATAALWCQVLGGVTAFAAVLTAAYILWMFQRVYMGPARPDNDPYAPIKIHEFAVLSVLGLAAILLGLFPYPLLQLVSPSIQALSTTLGWHY